jgi:hypothetical protein
MNKQIEKAFIPDIKVSDAKGCLLCTPLTKLGNEYIKNIKGVYMRHSYLPLNAHDNMLDNGLCVESDY